MSYSTTIEPTESSIDHFPLPNSDLSTDFSNSDMMNQYLNMNKDPYTIFLNAIKSSQTREKYNRRFKIFLDFIKIPGDTMKDRCIFLYENGKINNQ
ncbi:MAG TPA: hypothetical protein VFV86_07325 [Nitrososphaeraceae archaeon]|nr:hypothetical protein [Nitrososphaeraceae archaeon]